MRISMERPPRLFSELIRQKHGPMLRAMTAAMDQATEELKTGGRQEMARAGFSGRFQRAFTARRFPKGRPDTLDQAAFAWHRVPYAGVFETGARISGRPMLWLPLPSAPRSVTKRRMPPSRFIAKVAPLFGFRTPSGTPVLAAQARVSRRQAQRARPKASMAALRRGGAGGGRGVLRSIPIYHGVRMVDIRKRFDTTEAARSVRNRIGDFYFANLRDD